MQNELAIPIKLDVWQDPQGDIILHSSGRDCFVYFGCWDDESNPCDYIARISFNGCIASKYIHSQFLNYKVEEHNFHSYILSIQNSSWVKQVAENEKRIYGDRAIDYSLYLHYVVQGHDVYVEIIAKEFTLTKIYRHEAGDIVRLIDEA
ncbi:MAG TPA: hypothetical protein VEZ13_13540 [Brevibacillus sp.]|nr:hypothetical protein [Brevibacillus sp.]